MSLQRGMGLITGLCACLLADVSAASPPPHLGWSRATIAVDPGKGVGPVRFELECPGGRLTSLSASGRGFKATVPLEKLKKLNLPETCSGASTSLTMESDDPSTRPIGIAFSIEMSSEYVKRDLSFSLDLRTGKFTRAEYVETAVGAQQSRIEKVEL
jgi:hypothetical protein